jgi:8-oxo-dGTP pyrophosphatase MutT (NUDIX family)
VIAKQRRNVCEGDQLSKLEKQVGALATRRKNGKKEVLLVTTRGNGKGTWIIPKGSRSCRLDDDAAAAREALEEGGVTGQIEPRPLGQCTHRKRNGEAKKIDVYRLKVEEELKHWPEEKERKRKWVSPQKAKSLVTDPRLKRIINQS